MCESSFTSAFKVKIIVWLDKMNIQKVLVFQEMSSVVPECMNGIL